MLIISDCVQYKCYYLCAKQKSVNIFRWGGGVKVFPRTACGCQKEWENHVVWGKVDRRKSMDGNKYSKLNPLNHKL